MSSSSASSESDIIIEREEDIPRRLSVRVHRHDLKSSTNNGLIKSSLFSRIRDRVPLVNLKRIAIQDSRHGTEDTLLYCPETADCENTRANPTQFVRVDPRSTPDLVYRDDEFEVSFIGMSATPQDTGRHNNNELLLYSLLREQLCADICQDDSSASSPPLPDASTDLTSAHVPTGISANSDVPYIHYDPVIDGHDQGTLPDSFVPIPASKRIYYRHVKDKSHNRKCQEVFNVRFTLMEIDKISDILARAPSSVDQLGTYVSSTASQVPYIELVAKALSFASQLGKHGIKEYARPDHVLSTDAEFLLANREEGLPQKEGDYLRYGTYFFLSKPVDAQIYAQTCSSSQHMPLLLKRVNLNMKRASKNEKLFFPLTGVSYLVMKVTKGCKNHGFEHTPSVHAEHRKRLDNMLQMRGVIEMLAGVNENAKASRKNRKD